MDTPQAEFEQCLREAIARDSGRLLGHGYQATVRRYASPRGQVVVKSPHGAQLLGWFGRHAIRREHGIYKRLGGIAGIPRLHGLLDDRHLVLESIEGPSLREHEAELDDRERFFAQLLETIEAMHTAGVAHADLKRKNNILVGPGQRPYLIDFGVACPGSDQLRGWHRWRFEWFKQLDYNAWIKLKYGSGVREFSAADAARYRPLWIERIARWIRIPWQKVTLRRPRQRLRRWLKRIWGQTPPGV